MSVKHSLLALLSTGPMYGQQLKDEFESRTGELWPLNVGQVYTSLARLERDGMVAPALADETADDSTRPFEITPEGQIELDLWLKESPALNAPPRDDIVMKVMIAVSIDPRGSVEIAQSHRRQLLQVMRTYATLKMDPSATTAVLMMCDAELFRLEAAVRWLDSVDARVRSGATLESASIQSIVPRTTSVQRTTDRTEIQS